jgi:hypothetical protein
MLIPYYPLGRIFQILFETSKKSITGHISPLAGSTGLKGEGYLLNFARNQSTYYFIIPHD